MLDADRHGDKPTTRRGAVAAEMTRLADEASARDPSLGALLGRLADAIRAGRRHEVAGYVGAIVYGSGT